MILLSACGPNYDLPLPPTSIPLESNDAGNLTAPGLTPPAYPITLPEGFQINVFSAGLQNPKMMAFGPDGHLYITESDSGNVLRLLDSDGDGEAEQTEVAADGLIEPSGLAFFNDGSLYVAETTRVFRFSDPDSDGYFEERESVLSGIPAGGFTNRTLIFSPDWRRLYMAVGSSCNVCEEIDQRRGTILIIYPDTGDHEIYASGIRYAVGLDFQAGDEAIWTAIVGREGLSDGFPPDTIYKVSWYVDAGWPECHAGTIIDPDFGAKDSCSEVQKPAIYLEAGSAPHGIEFYTGSQFPAEYLGDLFIALHGSGENGQAKGYKIVRRGIGDGDQKEVEDFAVGWIGEDGLPWGTPMDLIQGPDGSLYLSDDLAGVIYRISYEGN
jgi:glucose/arabinose dehydrogenase